MTLPYHQGVTEPLIRHLRKIGISTSIQSRGTLREHLVHPKDKLERLEINGVVYYHGCAGHNGNPCPENYVGESGRSAIARNSEHFSTAQTAPGVYKSAIMQHAADAQHHFRSEDIQILSRETDWHKRGTREAMAIRAISPSLNRNEGRHDLPHCYDSLLRKAVRKPNPPTPHSPTEPLLNTEKRGPGRPRTRPSVTDETTAVKQIEQTIASNSTHNMTTRSRATSSQEGRGLT